MKHTGTIEIDCGDNTCDDCELVIEKSPSNYICGAFNCGVDYDNSICNFRRCEACLNNFKEIKDEEIKS